MADPVTATALVFGALAANNSAKRQEFKMGLDASRFREANKPIAPPIPEKLAEPVRPQTDITKLERNRGRIGTLLTSGLGLSGQGPGYRKTLLGQ